jgi:hypothetical protein
METPFHSWRHRSHQRSSIREPTDRGRRLFDGGGGG